jgi:CheY-like chemotaxis protein
MHALIIEDEPLIAMTIEEVLRDCGFTSFDLAVSSEQAVAFAGSKCPDLITADVELRPGSGIEAVNLICTGPSIPVIFITGSSDEVTEKVPQYPFIRKPFRAEMLVDAVKLALTKN